MASIMKTQKEIEESVLPSLLGQYETSIQMLRRMRSKALPQYYRMVGYAAALRAVLDSMGVLDQAKEQWTPPKPE
jgi:hypothetical protein